MSTATQPSGAPSTAAAAAAAAADGAPSPSSAAWRAAQQPPVSLRVRSTDPPVIAKTKAIISASSRADVASLAQGVVHWGPPRAALRAAAAATAAALENEPHSAGGGPLNSYGPTPGLPALRAALKRQLVARGLPGYAPVVTPGANCAFTVALLALCDEGDSVALFCPVYFNHKMSVQMTGGAAGLMLAPLRPDLRPDLDWLERVMASPGDAGGGDTGDAGGGDTGDAGSGDTGDAGGGDTGDAGGGDTGDAGGGDTGDAGGGDTGDAGGACRKAPKVVVLVNPANPTGILLTRQELDRAAALAAAAGAWLVVDNTYCDFVFDGAEHYCPAGPHIVHLFSLSKAYGMMGWRVGYVALPPGAAPDGPKAAAAAAAAARAGGGRASMEEDLGDGGALMSEILKVQDSIPICAAQISQIVALAALEGDGGAAAGHPDASHASGGPGGGGGAAAAGRAANEEEEARVRELVGREYVAARVAALARGNRESVGAALRAALGPGRVRGGEGGIYFFAQLPDGFESRDEDVVRWLVAKAGVCVVPGSACHAPGWLRVGFANLPPAACAAAAGRLGGGLRELAERGPAALDEDLP